MTRGGRRVLTRAEMVEKLARISEANDNGCQIMRVVRSDGYAKVTWNHRFHSAHRLAYELLVGPIPPGMTLDHLCHTRDPECRGGVTCPHRACVNVEHLEMVTGAENTGRGYKARKTHCHNGHPLSGANLYRPPPSTSRVCRTCAKARGQNYKIRKQMQAAGISA